jgi:hypothetical protein
MSAVESDSMDRSIELSTPFEEVSVESRFSELSTTIRPWKLPIPLKITYSSLAAAELKHPSAPHAKAFNLRGRAYPSVLSFPPTGSGSARRHWLVLTGSWNENVSLPLGDDAFAYETEPCIRVDGSVLKMAHTGTNRQVHTSFVSLDRCTLSSLTARILEFDSDSRILARLSPRYTTATLRLWRTRQLYQFWSAI